MTTEQQAQVFGQLVGLGERAVAVLEAHEQTAQKALVMFGEMTTRLERIEEKLDHVASEQNRIKRRVQSNVVR